MKFTCQQSCLNSLQQLCDSSRHSLLISGPSGSGKTYLAGQYSDMLGIRDFQLVNPTVQVIRDTLDLCLQFDSPIVLCIENLDLGVKAAAYTLLKNLEEPQENLYIIVTCRNIRQVPSTITSRCVCLEVNPPSDTDISQYASIKDNTKFQHRIWRSVKSFLDVDTLFNLSLEEQDYLFQYPDILKARDSISSLQWKMSHFQDNSELPLTLALRYLLDSFPETNAYIRRNCIECLNDISTGRIASHAALAKFILEYKYGG